MSVHRIKCTVFIQQLEYSSKNELLWRKFWGVMKCSIVIVVVFTISHMQSCQSGSQMSVIWVYRRLLSRTTLFLLLLIDCNFIFHPFSYFSSQIRSNNRLYWLNFHSAHTSPAYRYQNWYSCFPNYELKSHKIEYFQHRQGGDDQIKKIFKRKILSLANEKQYWMVVVINYYYSKVFTASSWGKIILPHSTDIRFDSFTSLWIMKCEQTWHVTFGHKTRNSPWFAISFFFLCQDAISVSSWGGSIILGGVMMDK